MMQHFSASAFRESRELRFAFGPGGIEGGFNNRPGPDARPDWHDLNNISREGIVNRVDGIARMRVGTIANNPYYRDFPPATPFNFRTSGFQPRMRSMMSGLVQQRGYTRIGGGYGYGLPLGESPNQMRAARFRAITNSQGGSAVIGNERVPNFNMLFRDPQYDPRDFTRYTQSANPNVAAFAIAAQKDQAKYLRRGDYREMYRLNQIWDNTGRMDEVWTQMRGLEQQYAGRTPLSSQRINVQGWDVHSQLQILVQKGPDEYDYIQHKPFSAVQFEDWKQGNSLRIMQENGIVIKLKVRNWMEGVKPFPESVTVEFHKPGTYIVDGRKIVVGGGTPSGAPGTTPPSPEPPPAGRTA